MSGRLTYSIRKFARDMGGTTLVELAIVLPIFLLIFFGLIDFGRMGAEYVMAEKGHAARRAHCRRQTPCLCRRSDRDFARCSCA